MITLQLGNLINLEWLCLVWLDWVVSAWVFEMTCEVILIVLHLLPLCDRNVLQSHRIVTWSCLASTVSAQHHFSLLTVQSLVKWQTGLSFCNNWILTRMPFYWSFDCMKGLHLELLYVNAFIRLMMRLSLIVGLVEKALTVYIVWRDVPLGFPVSMFAGFSQIKFAGLIQIDSCNLFLVKLALFCCLLCLSLLHFSDQLFRQALGVELGSRLNRLLRCIKMEF